MKAAYNKSKIMRNAWYLRKVQPSMTLAACLRKAWSNEKRNILLAKIEGRNLTQEDARPELPWTPIEVPADYYGERGRYYGD